jgi:carbon storage regulator CsrA
MLVLSRKVDEEIVIGGAVRVRVLEVGRGHVRIGVTAPKEIEILRAELMPTNDQDGSESRENEATNVLHEEPDTKESS